MDSIKCSKVIKCDSKRRSHFIFQAKLRFVTENVDSQTQEQFGLLRSSSLQTLWNWKGTIFLCSSRRTSDPLSSSALDDSAGFDGSTGFLVSTGFETGFSVWTFSSSDCLSICGAAKAVAHKSEKTINKAGLIFIGLVLSSENCNGC